MVVSFEKGGFYKKGGPFINQMGKFMITPISKMKKRDLIISIGLILAITFISFFPSLKNDFVNWDDNSYVTENNLIMELSWETIKTIFNHFYMGHYHPLTLLSYSMEYLFFKLNPFIYHTTNLILHLCNSLLVLWLVLILTGRLFTSLVVALLFGIHPMHVESVVWISERKDVLYSFFFLGSMISYLFYQKTKEIKYYYLLFFLFVLSILSKAMAITLPFVLLLVDYLLERKFDKKLLLEKVPFFVITLCFGVIAISAQGAIETVKQEYAISFFDKIFIYINLLVFYLTKIIIPVKLACMYPSISEISSSGPYHFLYLPAMVGFLIVCLLSVRYTKKILFGLLFFLVTILPVLPLKIVADRYTYIPYIGIFYIFGEVFSWLCQRRTRELRIMRPFLLVVLFGIIGIFSFLTWERGQVWENSVRLWDDVLKKYPNVLIAYIDRGQGYSERRQYDQAISDYTQALEINPRYAEAYYNRGNAHGKKDLIDQAILDYTKALEVNPRYAEAYYNRGNAHGKKKMFDQAIFDYTKALKINSKYFEAYTNRGSAYSIEGQYEQALSDFSKALEINPRYAIAYFNKALVCETTGRIWDAIQAYKGFIKNAEPQQSQHIEIARERIKELSSGLR